MADGSKIEWTDATWNPITGCSVVSPGCTNCYAMRLAGTRMKHHPSREGLTEPSKAGPVWNGQVRFNEDWLHQPLKWQRRRLIFVCAHGDLFHENIPDEWIDRVFAVMALAPQHTFQVLTKRADRMRAYLTAGESERFVAGCAAKTRVAGIARAMAPDGSDGLRKMNDLWLSPDTRDAKGWPLPNVWLGVSAEDQTRAEERIPDLLNTPAAVRWVSAEPLLGPVDVSYWTTPNRLIDRPGLDWVVAGGESGPNARPMHPDWARGLRDQCKAAGVPFHFKQWGAHIDHLSWIRENKPRPTPAVPTRDHAWLNNEGVALRSCDEAYKRMNKDDDRGNPTAWKLMLRVGKKAAGRLLDGKEHNEFPEAT